MKKALASIGIGGALTFGAVDASVLNEKPLERIETIAAERVEAKQEGNVVATRFPWKGEEGLTIKYDLGTPSLTERLADKRKKEVVTEVVDFGEGGFKVDVVLYEKPDTNVFCYDIEGYENYDFFFQPFVAPEGLIYPDESIAGSYAVYHKTLRDHETSGINYAVGKMAHIPYPYIWEVNNEEATKHRAEAFTIKDGRMCVTASEEFLKTATYPVRIDPTIGYTTLPTSDGIICQLSSDLSGMRGYTYALPEDGTLDSITVGLKQTTTGDSVDVFAALYREDSAGSGSHALVASVEQLGQTTLTTSNDWYTYTASGEALTVDDYILAVVCDGEDLGTAASVSIKQDSLGPTHNFYYEQSTGAGGYSTRKSENPWTEGASALTVNGSIYATYTADAGEEEDPVTPTTVLQGDVSFTGDAVVQ